MSKKEVMPNETTGNAVVRPDDIPGAASGRKHAMGGPMIFRVGESVMKRSNRIFRLTRQEQPWEIVFAWRPVRLRDNVWIWWEYYERSPVFSQNWNLTSGVEFMHYRIRSILHEPAARETEGDAK